MGQDQRQKLNAPVGMATSRDKEDIAENMAQMVLNFLPSRQGESHPQFPLFTDNYNSYFFAGVVSIAIYKDPDPRFDQVVLFMADGTVQSAAMNSWYPSETQLVVGPSGYLPVQNLTPSATPLLIPGAAYPGPFRWVQYNDELIVVRGALMPATDVPFSVTRGDGGIKPVRIKQLTPGSGLPLVMYQCGINTPAAPAVADGAAGAIPAGSYNYYLVFVDEVSRDSSPSPAYAYTAPGAKKANVTYPTWPLDPQVKYVDVYRSTIGPGAVAYRVTAGHTYTIVGGENNTTVLVADNILDTPLQLNKAMPLFGQNDPPTPASSIIVHGGDRILLDDAADRTTIVVSNANSATQFSSSPLLATDGDRIPVGSDPGDFIVGFGNYGAMTGIFRRRQSYLFGGDNKSNFFTQPIHIQGCTSGDAIERCGDVVTFVSDNGIYASGYMDGFRLVNLTGDIEDQFIGTQMDSSLREYLVDSGKARAVSWFHNQRLYVCIGVKTYVYDFANGQDAAWTQVDYGAVVSAAVYHREGVGDTVLMATAGLFADPPNLWPQAIYWFNPFLPPPAGFHTVGFTRQTIVTRPFDGEGPARERRKRARRLTLWGSFEGVTPPKGTVIGVLTLHSDTGRRENRNLSFGMGNAKRTPDKLAETGLHGTVGELLWAELEFNPAYRVIMKSVMLEYEPI